MNSVGIDISKGKSTVAIMRPLGEVVAPPFEVCHTTSKLSDLVNYLKTLDGEVRVVLEYTGHYHQSIARYLCEAGLFVSAIHPKLMHDFANNSIRKVKTDKADAIKIANYGLANWAILQRYMPEDETRALLKNYNRQYHEYGRIKSSLKNNLIALVDKCFPGVNKMFSNHAKADGSEKWVDFVEKFWHCDVVTAMSKAKFTTQYNKWSTKHGYVPSDSKAADLYDFATQQIATLPPSEETRSLIVYAVSQVKFVSSSLISLRREMLRLSALLPEYHVVLSMGGVGEILGPQLIAEIGDVRRFSHKGALVAFAGVDASPFQSGTFESTSRKISKRGSPALRKALFQVMMSLLQRSPQDEPVYQFLDRKRTEGKRYYVYMVAGCNKFLRIYYARVKAYLDSLDTAA